MDALFDGLRLVNNRGDLLRNIKSIRRSQELFDDLSDTPSEWEVAKRAELVAKPHGYGAQPVIRRPFERARYFNAIRFPFLHWAASRFSDGSYGVWYGSDVLVTTIYETVHHWLRFLRAAGFHAHHRDVIGERRVYRVRCNASLLDFRPQVGKFAALADPDSYDYTQEVGRRIQREGHPGLVSRSARCRGDIYAVFKESVLHDPRNYCELTYVLRPDADEIRVERQQGRKLMTVPVS